MIVFNSHKALITKKRVRILCCVGWIFSYLYISAMFIASFHAEGSSDGNAACEPTNYLPVKYLYGIYFPMLALIVMLTLLLNGRMVYVLKKRASNMTSMTSNQHSVTSAQASADAMRKLTLFVTGIILVGGSTSKKRLIKEV